MKRPRRPRLLRPNKRRRNMILVILCVLTLSVVLYGMPRERTYLIEANTSAATLVFDGLATRAWRFPEAHVCIRHRPRQAEAVTKTILGRICPSQLFTLARLENLSLDIPDGTLLEVRRAEPIWTAPLDIFLPRQRPDKNGKAAPEAPHFEGRDPATGDTVSGELVPGSHILVDNDIWMQTGSLLFAGQIILGAVPRNNLTDILFDGRYEVREVPLLDRWSEMLFGTQPATVPIKQGEFFKGDELRLLETEGDNVGEGATVTGFFLSDGPESKGFQALVYGTHGHALLEINRYGAVGAQSGPKAPAVVAPSWTDRAINDPFLLALSALLALLLASIELANAFGLVPEQTQEKDETEPEGDEPALQASVAKPHPAAESMPLQQPTPPTAPEATEVSEKTMGRPVSDDAERPTEASNRIDAASSDSRASSQEGSPDRTSP